MVNQKNVRSTLAFDLDGTLTPSKSAMTPEMSEMFVKLLDRYQVCVISGASFEQFKKQILNGLSASGEELGRLHLMAACGTQYYRYRNGSWQKVYAENFSDEQKREILGGLDRAVDTLDIHEAQTYGPLIEDLGSQITYSALGQDVVAELGEAGVELKEAWDPDDTKKKAIVDFLVPLLPDYEVRAGGTTSIDITKKGIDKAYGMRKLIEITGVPAEDILFFGDKLEPGGNDYPVKSVGIETVAVKDWRDTLEKLTLILK